MKISSDRPMNVRVGISPVFAKVTFVILSALQYKVFMQIY